MWFLCFILPLPCLCVSSGAAPLPGVDTVTGRLQECDALSQMSGSVSVLPYIHHQTIKIALQPSITSSLSLLLGSLSESERKPPRASC